MINHPVWGTSINGNPHVTDFWPSGTTTLARLGDVRPRFGEAGHDQHVRRCCCETVPWGDKGNKKDDKKQQKWNLVHKHGQHWGTWPTQKNIKDLDSPWTNHQNTPFFFAVVLAVQYSSKISPGSRRRLRGGSHLSHHFRHGRHGLRLGATEWVAMLGGQYVYICTAAAMSTGLAALLHTQVGPWNAGIRWAVTKMGLEDLGMIKQYRSFFFEMEQGKHSPALLML